MLSPQVVDVYILWAAQWSHAALDLILSQFRKFILWENADWIKKKYILWKATLSIAKNQKNVTNASPRFGGERLVLHFFDHFWGRFFPCPSVRHFTHHATATVPCHSSRIRSTFNFFCTNKDALQLFWVDCSGGWVAACTPFLTVLAGLDRSPAIMNNPSSPFITYVRTLTQLWALVVSSSVPPFVCLWKRWGNVRELSRGEAWVMQMRAS